MHRHSSLGSPGLRSARNTQEEDVSSHLPRAKYEASTDHSDGAWATGITTMAVVKRERGQHPPQITPWADPVLDDEHHSMTPAGEKKETLFFSASPSPPLVAQPLFGSEVEIAWTARSDGRLALYDGAKRSALSQPETLLSKDESNHAMLDSEIDFPDVEIDEDAAARFLVELDRNPYLSKVDVLSHEQIASESLCSGLTASDPCHKIPSEGDKETPGIRANIADDSTSTSDTGKGGQTLNDVHLLHAQTTRKLDFLQSARDQPDMKRRPGATPLTYSASIAKQPANVQTNIRLKSPDPAPKGSPDRPVGQVKTTQPKSQAPTVSDPNPNPTTKSDYVRPRWRNIQDFEAEQAAGASKEKAKKKLGIAKKCKQPFKVEEDIDELRDDDDTYVLPKSIIHEEKLAEIQQSRDQTASPSYRPKQPTGAHQDAVVSSVRSSGALAQSEGKQKPKGQAERYVGGPQPDDGMRPQKDVHARTLPELASILSQFQPAPTQSPDSMIEKRTFSGHQRVSGITIDTRIVKKQKIDRKPDGTRGASEKLIVQDPAGPVQRKTMTPYTQAKVKKERTGGYADKQRPLDPITILSAASLNKFSDPAHLSKHPQGPSREDVAGEQDGNPRTTPLEVEGNVIDWIKDPDIANPAWYIEAATVSPRTLSALTIFMQDDLTCNLSLVLALRQQGLHFIQLPSLYQNVDIVLSPNVAVIFYDLLSLPEKEEALVKKINCASAFYSQVILCFVISPSEISITGQSHSGSNEKFGPLNPKVRTALHQVKRLYPIRSANSRDVFGEVQVVYSHCGSEEVVKVLRWLLSEEKESMKGRLDPQFYKDLYEDHRWLAEDQSASLHLTKEELDLRELCRTYGLNLFQAWYALWRFGSVSQILAMSHGQRMKRLAPIFGDRVIVSVSLMPDGV
ncbi:hypothetical protein IAR55_002846 [Kwoniella newhampshirensis]|uniref:Uncharacterized protein n=1 Tax=Kwoniella newhampshirensis TaxID=1651941 RepID=A0AAW0Z045_9TREE